MKETPVISDVAPANGIHIAYDAFGDASDPAIVLIMGLATQRVAWPDELCEDLAQSGHYVVRFDNRDVGESTHFPELGLPALRDVVRRRAPAYGLADMAEDVVGLIDALDLGTVHLVGASMGGFIAQTVAVHHPDRIRTLTLIMTSTGGWCVGRASARVLAQLARRRPTTTRTAAINEALRTFRLIGSSGFPFDESWLRTIAGISYDRSADPGGQRRQLAAILDQPNRAADLRRITVPTLVIHGLNDPLVSPTGGLAIARAIPQSTFVGFTGMGHDLPRPLWPAIAREIKALTHADLAAVMPSVVAAQSG